MIEGALAIVCLFLGVFLGIRLAYIWFMNLIRGNAPRFYFWAFWRNKERPL